MTKENILLVLWIIFGFIFITGIDAILNFICYLIYFAQLEAGIPLGIINYSMPIITLLLYLSTTFLMLKNIKLDTNLSGIYLTRFPKRLFIVLGVISIFLIPITSKLSGLYTERLTIKETVYNSYEFLATYGWLTSGIYISRWIILIVLTIIFLKKLKLIENLN
ncbi:hypothetical protein [Mangrovimonas sp. DI 80]|uniref:hypothetical protein n=1 Tax=Mangrovimonas sp. DI 80 TaxID=1779330 RepID=UPI0009772988|nr:hypothetical protein [Mangrovimonas sp. DI 80]OMP32588.1 hypothetical protein BKM32_05970 [Mangrovimonas sp. DI 80]